MSQGDSVSRFAERYGLAPDTIWDHPDNEALQREREHMDVLLPGDELVIPAIRVATVSCATDRQHRFRRRGVPMRFELQALDACGAALAHRPYTLLADHLELRGTTDANGYLSEYIPNATRQGRITIEDELDRVVYFGHLDPISTLTGVQKRLSNMGFACAEDGGQTGRATIRALLLFQRLSGLEPSGALDDATRDEIRRCHDDPSRLAAHLERAAQAPALT